MKRPSKAKKLPGIYTRGETFWFTYRLNGKKHFHSLGTSDYGEAVQKALAIRENPELTPAAVFEQEIAAFIAYKVARDDYSRFSAENKVYALRRFAKVTGRANPSLVTPADVEAFYRGERARIEEGSVRSYLATVRSFFNWQVKSRKMRHNPVAKLEYDRADPKARDKFCTPDLRDKLVAEAPTDELRLILFLGFHAGLRKNEIVQARPEWFDLERGSLNVRETATFRPKDREARTIPLTAAFRAFLVRHGLPEPFILRPEVTDSKQLYRTSFNRSFKAYTKAQGCPWVTLHVLRRTFASLLASAGVSIYKIANWLGDEVGTTQRHYARLLPGDTDIERAFQ